MKKIILSSIILCLSLLGFTGCTSSPKPIKTTLTVGESTKLGGLPAFDYGSEKDVLLSKTETDPETGIVYQLDFKALASAAAYAQAERETEYYKAQTAQAEITAAALQLLGTSLGNNAQQVLAPGSATDLDRARNGQPLIRAVEE